MNLRIQFVSLALLLIWTVAVQAQALNSGAQAIALNANLAESISITLSANTVNFTLTSGSANNAGSGPVTATTAWTLRTGRTLRLYAYFASSAAALTNGAGNNIPSADFSVSDNGGAYRTITNTVAFGGAAAGRQLYRVGINAANRNSTHVDTMLFNINLSTIPQLPAGTYTGVLNIQAQAI